MASGTFDAAPGISDPHLPDDAPLLLDVTRLIWRRWKSRLPTGIDRVALAYLRHFGPRSQAVVQHKRFRRILDSRASKDLFDLLSTPGEHFKRRMITGAFKHAGGLNGRGRGRFYLNVGHTGLDSPGFRAWIRNADVRPIYLTHDIIPISHPQFARPGEDQRHRERMVTVLKTAAGVIGNSQATLDELARFAAAEQLAMPPAIVAWLGTDPLPAVPTQQHSGRATFVTVGTIEGRKNHLLLLSVWQRLIERLGDAAPRLLIIGQRGWEAEDAFQRLDRDETLRQSVVELGRCGDTELAEHLASARALLFPSFAEGYGLPLIEALAAGVPVIASDLPVFRELCGAIPTYADPTDEKGWETAILDYARPDSASREAQRQRLSGFRAPDWATHFSIVEGWLAHLASSQAAPASTE
jgi:glycosyltransferase involved in cell wall biosynthesis